MKPVKRVLSKEQPLNYLHYDKGYNHCFDDYETYLKSEGVENKLFDLIWKANMDANGNTFGQYSKSKYAEKLVKLIIQAITGGE